MNRTLQTLICLLFCLPIKGQAQTPAVADSLQFDFDSFMQQVAAHHPLALQADLLLETGEAAVLKARGGFDPKAGTEVYQKYFDDKQYYSLINGGLKVPTWFGLEFKGGLEQNTGAFLNPENTLPSAGLWYAGITVPIGRGLFIDERRAMLRQAQVFQDMTEQERLLTVNNLLFDAARAYWYWSGSYQNRQILLDAVEAARVRFEAVKQAALFGDRAAIDTLEAGIQLQNLQVSLQAAEIDYFKAGMYLSTFLWLEGTLPMEISNTTIPSVITGPLPDWLQPELLPNTASIVSAHPAIQYYGLKLDELDIERRWKAEQLKPRIDLSYNPITENVGGNPITGFSPENYTWGLSFSMPLLLRKERGDLTLTKIKMENTYLQREQKTLDLSTKINAYYNEWNISNDQIVIFEQAVADYFTLWQAEIRLFDNGESSLFLINSRQQSYISALQKLNEFRIKNKIAVSGLNWSTAKFATWYNQLTP
jgi:outer membrane protein TolC